MSYIILKVIVILLALIGLMSLIKSMIFRILSPKSNPAFIIVTPIEGNNESAEFLLRSIGEKAKWSRPALPEKIICLDQNMDASTREICEAVSTQYAGMSVMNWEELKDELKLK